MMKRFLLAFTLCLLAMPAWAACGVSNLQVKDNAGTTANVPYADDGSGGTNCSPQIQIKQGGNTVAVKGAATPVGAADTPLAVAPSPYNALATTGTGWTSATTVNSTQTLMPAGVGAPTVLVQLVQTSTITGGAVTFECTYDSVPDWVTIPTAQVLNPNTFAQLTNPYTLVASTNQPFLISSQGCQQIRVRLSTVITGSATVTPYITQIPYSTGPVSALAAVGAAVTMQNAATANGNGTTLAAGGFNTALVNVNCSVACSGGTTVNFEGTDATGTYFFIAAVPVSSGAAVTSVTNLATNAQYWVPLSGLTTIRARISAYSAGTITVTGTPVNGVNAELAAIAGTVTVNGSGVTQPVSIASGQAVDGAIATLGTKADTATCATSNSAIACLRQIDADVNLGVGATGSGVPSSSIYPGVNVGGTLRGATGVNPSGSIFAQQVDLASVAGTTTATGNGVSGAGTQRVNIASDNSVFSVSADIIVTPSANFTRPANATQYAVGNLVANSTTAGSVTPMSWTAARVNAGNFYVRRFKMTLSSKSITSTSFRLHLFTVTPATITNGDGGAFSVTMANEFCTLDALVSATDPVNWQAGADVSIGYGVPGKGNECNAVAAGGTTTIFGLLEARATYTPTSGETITVIPEIHQN